MSHALQAFITRDENVGTLMAVHGRVFNLAQGYFVLPLGDEMLSRLGIPMLAFDEDDRPGLFMSIDSLGVELSQTGPVAYIEAVDLGSINYAGAVVYKNSEIAMPRAKESGVLDRALRALGGEAWTTDDLFTALDLGQHRSANDWPAAEAAL